MLSLWVNGIQQTATGSVSGLVNPPGDLYIGRHNGYSYQDWSGLIDEVRIHNRALEPAELNSHVAVAEALSVHPVGGTAAPLAYPNPVTEWPVTFDLRSKDAVSLRVQIYDLARTMVYDSDWVLGSRVEWPGLNARGERAANGAYSCILLRRPEEGPEESAPPATIFVAT